MKKCYIGFLLLLMTSPLFMRGKEHQVYAQVRPGTRFATTKALQDTATAIDARSTALWLSLVDSLKVAAQIWSAADTLGSKAALGAPSVSSWYISYDGADNPVMNFIDDAGNKMTITAIDDTIKYAGADAWIVDNGLIIQHNGTMQVWGHSPTGLAIEGISEFDGNAFFDASVDFANAPTLATVPAWMDSSHHIANGLAGSNMVNPFRLPHPMFVTGLITQHDGTLPSWGHSPAGLAVEGIAEFDGALYSDGLLTVAGAFTSPGIDDNADAIAITIDVTTEKVTFSADAEVTSTLEVNELVETRLP